MKSISGQGHSRSTNPCIMDAQASKEGLQDNHTNRCSRSMRNLRSAHPAMWPNMLVPRGSESDTPTRLGSARLCGRERAHVCAQGDVAAHGGSRGVGSFGHHQLLKLSRFVRGLILRSHAALKIKLFMSEGCAGM